MTISKKIDRYEIIEEIGHGGMATVYLARDPRFRREVAVKVLPPQYTADPMFRARFEREAQTIAALEHPAIVPVHDFGEDNGQPFLVMRYMPGGSLAEKLINGPISVDKTIKILKRIASALDRAHSRGIIHRDLKPGNILFDRYGEAFMADFGIAKMSEATAALTGSGLIGTPSYMSPEQVKGEEVDGRSDIYALGVILFEMLSGQQPFEAPTPIALALKHVNAPIPDVRTVNNDLPPMLQHTINQAMSKKREDRFQTAGKMVQNLLLDLKLASYAASQAAPQKKPTPPLSAVAPASNDNAPDNAKSDEAPPPAPITVTNPPIVPTWVWIALVTIVAATAVGAGFIFARNNSQSSPETDDQDVAAVVFTATQTISTPTAMPTETQVPTSMPTDAPTATLMATEVVPTETAVSTETPTPTATLCPPPQAKIVLASINIRRGPSSRYDSIKFGFENDEFPILSRIDDNSWYLVVLDEDENGWISDTVIDIVTMDGCETEIPIAASEDIPPLPTSTPVPPTNTPEPTSVQDSGSSSGGGGGGTANTPTPAHPP